MCAYTTSTVQIRYLKHTYFFLIWPNVYTLCYSFFSRCNGLEEVVGDEPDIGLEVHAATKSVSFKVKPFQIVSLMMEL